MTELKPCPFCGRDNCMEVWDSPVELDMSTIHLWRVSCSAAPGIEGCGGSGGVMATRELAIKAWNRRANGCCSENG